MKQLKFIKKLPKISIWFASFLLVTFFIFLNLNHNSLKQKKFNVILISVDSLRQDHLSTYGYAEETDPYLKKFASESIVFENAYVLVPQTYPSFATLFTGNSQFSSGIFSNVSYDPEVKNFVFKNTAKLTSADNTLPYILRQHDYQTAAFVTNGILSGNFTGLDDQFDIYEQFNVNSIEQLKSDRSSYDSFIQQALSWLTERPEKPFFYWLHLMDPHYPYFPPEKTRCKFQSSPECMTDTNTLKEVIEYGAPYFACSDKPVPSEMLNLHRTLYDEEIASADTIFGKILEVLRDEGLFDDSIVLFYSDHGESFGHSYYFSHGEGLYQSTVKVPFAIHVPGESKGRRVKQTITNADIYPTILDVLNIEHAGKVEGMSFRNAFRRSGFFNHETEYEQNRKIFLSNYNLTKFAMIDGEYKYIYSFPQACIHNGFMSELYNTEKDPHEENNLVSSEVKIAQSMKDELLQYISDTRILESTPSASQYEELQDAQLIEDLKSLRY
ncbi:MAG: sulfatase [Candidatus Roizmanbacteria bacterium]|nr:sulfatase [Candidatus Roizmanbacteria bacterium]